LPSFFMCYLLVPILLITIMESEPFFWMLERIMFSFFSVAFLIVFLDLSPFFGLWNTFDFEFCIIF
jgi:hypothetical protein